MSGLGGEIEDTSGISRFPLGFQEKCTKICTRCGPLGLASVCKMKGSS